MLAALAVAILAGLMAPAGCAPEPAEVEAVRIPASAPAPLRLGVGRVSITPTDTEFLAGGVPYRRWVQAHDDLWARALVLDDGVRRFALVAIDLIGLYADDVARARAALSDRGEKLDYVMIAATHTHNGPDVLGAWAPQIGPWIGGYRKQLPDKIAEAVSIALRDLREVRIRAYSGPVGQRLNKDTRPPEVLDETLTVWQARDAATSACRVTVIHFAAHPILVPAANFDISSDFPHYLREYVERGGDGDDGPIEAPGGMCVFFNGALGGRLTPGNVSPLKRPHRTRDLGYDRAQGYAYRLARRSLMQLAEHGVDWPAEVSLGVRSAPVQVELQNGLLRWGTNLCAFDRGVRAGKVTSEVALIDFGPLLLACVPGMLFPESVFGGAAPIRGSDFPDAAAESPALRELVGDRQLVVVGLANDMLGYLIPKPLWDSEPPYTSRDGEAPYGEMISPGPDACATVMTAFGRLAAE
jgi:hypothetical protein